jgi:hypothetical protein
MSEEENQGPSELETLKQRADLMGLKYHPKIGANKLAKMVEAHISGTVPNDDDSGLEEIVTTTVTKKSKTTSGSRPETPAELKVRLARQKDIKKKRAIELIRVRITNMNPNKNEWEGEILTVVSRLTGTVKKYIPFNAEEGYHVPRILLDMMRDKKVQVFTSIKRNGTEIRQGKMVPEYAIQELPNLTQAEYDVIANRQAAQSKSSD